ncbi:YdiU domain-containing protein [Blastomyces gilchristii SLH14081]|uniref:Selenoprotein O n=1 Tax=Blastomyces gilchristii (strain SLH14081) TaxID=559298 RepID=A0A179USJ2_BLAGS|nr:YdiU domain-containing protein [Blastomyces gilchristii SLH14081]OAT11066.1 YdiU domain-containing protein [Blastomyces gilchristii SLH14081]
MLLRSNIRQPQFVRFRIAQMAAHLSSSHTGNGNGNRNSLVTGVTLAELPKSNNFTAKLPADPAFETPESSHNAPREALGPRLVKGALFTYVRPEPTDRPELLSVSPQALKDIGLKDGEEKTAQFRDLVSGNKIFWDKENGGIYPWAQCYGGWQFGSWAGQLGDGRAISLFESTNPTTKTRYELQIKGAGRTPYSRFADGKAVLRSSIREYVVSEALNALGIPTTRALSLVLLPNSKVRRERLEPGAIVTRFAQSWIRIGTFDLPRSRGDRDLTRKLATYVAEDVFPGWESLPAALSSKSPDAKDTPSVDYPLRGVPKNEIQGEEGAEENRFTRLYREIVRRNAKTVAAWQAYGFMNGVLNTDNTSIMGLSLDYGPFAFLDNFDPQYTPNHDDHLLRYSYKNQPSVIWWNLVRLGESLGELMGAGDKVDDETFVSKGVTEEFSKILVQRAEKLIDNTGEEYKTVFLNEYKRLMSARLALKAPKESDFQELFSELLDTLEALELDFNHFFRHLSSISLADIDTDEKRKAISSIFFHKEGVGGIGNTEESARGRIAKWLSSWRERIVEDWGTETDEERQKAMKAVNPKFLPRSWILDEVIERVENKGDREILDRVMHMALNPFQEEWNWNKDEEERFCGDVPQFKRMTMCSCSS